MVVFSLVFLSVLLLSGAIVAGQNPTPVVLNLWFWRSVELPLGWITLAAVASGLWTSALLMLTFARQTVPASARHLQARLARLEQGEANPEESSL